MITGIMTLFFALLALSFLIVIHELGHYIVARRNGMDVEEFSIGFGRPIASWERGGVKWRLGWLPFGGFIRIKGMESRGGKEDPYNVPGGFFSKTPWQRIKVLIAGPFVNLIFAFIIFAVIWFMGGREANFGDFTRIVGWVDPQSELYKERVRPGDEILAYDGSEVHGSRDHIYAPLRAGETLKVEGMHVDTRSGEKTGFEKQVETYPHPLFLDEDIKTTGVLFPASYIIYQPSTVKLPDFASTLNAEQMGIEEGDRIIWADGVVLYSQKQLSEILNDDRVFLTIERGGSTIHMRVPRVRAREIKLSSFMRDEVSDWQYEANLTSLSLLDLYMLPYDLTPEGVVEERLPFIDVEDEEAFFPKEVFSKLYEPLQAGDRIVAVSGHQVREAHQIFLELQSRKVHTVVVRGTSWPPLKQTNEDVNFFANVDWNQLEKLVSNIGVSSSLAQVGDLVLLKPIVPLKRIDLMSSQELRENFEVAIREKQQEIEDVQNPEVRQRALELLKEQQNLRILGLYGIRDRPVIHNPGPVKLFKETTGDILETLGALFTGSLSPKWLSGPIGIVQVVQQSWTEGVREAFFWLGVISLNLGFLNLLPIPIFDGGKICIFLYEWVTRKPISPRAFEQLMVPFVFLLIGFFLYITLYDILRLVS